jgi:fructose-1,6-bisphosphatase/inositol monophosphatase family enzyme
MDELDKLANSTDSLENLDLMDFAYCYRVRELYTAYKDNQLTLEECKKAKAKVQHEYETFTQTANIYKKYQEGIKKSELLRSMVNKSNDVTEMLSKCLEIVSLLTGDTTFLTCNLRKLGG